MDLSTDHPIADLVGSFLEAAQAVVASEDPAWLEVRPAELTYELDQVVSHYLDAHQLSAEHHEAIQQDVVNSIAQHLVQEGVEAEGTSLFDPEGNAGLSDVLTLLDQHVVHSLASEPADDGSAFLHSAGGEHPMG